MSVSIFSPKFKVGDRVQLPKGSIPLVVSEVVLKPKGEVFYRLLVTKDSGEPGPELHHAYPEYTLHWEGETVAWNADHLDSYAGQLSSDLSRLDNQDPSRQHLDSDGSFDKPDYTIGDLVCVYKPSLVDTPPLLGFVVGVTALPSSYKRYADGEHQLSDVDWEYAVIHRPVGSEILTLEEVKDRSLDWKKFQAEKYNTGHSLRTRKYTSPWHPSLYPGFYREWESLFLSYRGDLSSHHWQIMEKALNTYFLGKSESIEYDPVIHPGGTYHDLKSYISRKIKNAPAKLDEHLSQHS